MNNFRILAGAIVLSLCMSLVTTPGVAQDDTPAPAETPEQDNTADNPSSDGSEQDGEMATESDQRAAEDAAVEEVLSEAELIYRDAEEDGDFIPSEQVSADQSLDYPVDI